MDDRDKLISNPPPPYDYGNTTGQQALPPPYYQHHPPPPVVRPNTIPVEQGRAIAVCTITPPDYTYLAVIALICFFPLGLVALRMTQRVKESVASGDIRKAYHEAIAARLLSRLSISLGTIILTVIILAIVLPVTLYGRSDY